MSAARLEARRWCQQAQADLAVVPTPPNIMRGTDVGEEITQLRCSKRTTMPSRQPRYSAEETARRGDEMYEQHIRWCKEPDHEDKV